MPYANGPIHIGHLLEHVQADIWVRSLRMDGNEVHFVCADDAHGTPIMLEAEKLGVEPESLIEGFRQAHLDDLRGFCVIHDNYHSTHSEENRKYSELIYSNLEKNGLITTDDVEQLYDPARKQFLADRYIRGICPHCKSPDQTGDNCDSCGATYAATELVNPLSALSGTKLELRRSLHHFFDLAKCSDFLREWVATEDPGPGPGRRLQSQAQNKLIEWFGDGLKPWDISRDAPYFGFKIPGTKDKYFYVWLDAPIGYMASFANLCEREGIDFDSYWNADSTAELYHFIGKDIMNFHGLFFPAMLKYSGFRTPTRLFIHGFLTVNGTKMSKSKGTFITASSYLEQKLNPDWFRYYIASKLNDNIEDVDLSLEDFVLRVNSDLVGKLANIPSRVAKIISRQFDNRLGPDAPVWIEPDIERLSGLFEQRRYSELTREVMALAEKVNQELEKAKPWKMRDPERKEELHAVCTAAIEGYRVLIGCLKPVVPDMAAASEEYLNCGEMQWAGLSKQLGAGHELGKFKHLARRVEAKQLARLVEANRENDDQDEIDDASAGAQGTISIEDFAKVELRVAEVLSAGEVEGSDKLLKLRVGLGELGERTVLAGIKGHLEPAELVGKKIVVCANLAPRKMRFGISEGMVLAAERTTGGLTILQPGDDAPAGSPIS